MAGEIATAFVRVRPNMEGFRSETESGVKSSFSGLAKIAGLAFGGAAIGELVKGSIESAAQTQAQGTAIAETFGKAGQSLVKFAETGGVALGSLEGATEGASVKFGQLFQNLGFSASQSARMTKQWEQLGLAINSIRGGGATGAAETLQQLSLAASGASTRGLNQLGLGISHATVQALAFKDGLISTLNQALTPAQRAMVTFQLATQNLPHYLREAATNSGNLANVQAKLAAEWDHAKTTLGQALLPEVTKLASAFSSWLAKMERSGRLQRDFNSIVATTGSVTRALVSIVTAAVHGWEGFTRAVGGSKHAIELLVAVFAATKVRAFGKAIEGDVGGALNRVRTRFAQVRAEAAQANKQIGEGSTQAAAKMGTAFQPAAAKVKADLGKAGIAAEQSGQKFGTAFQTASVKMKTSMAEAAASSSASAGRAGVAWTRFSTVGKNAASGVGTAVRTASTRAAATFDTAATAMKVAAIEVGATIKAAIIQTGIGLLVVAIGIAVGYVITHWETVKRYTVALGRAIGAVWHGVEEVVIGIGKSIAGALVFYMTEPIKLFLEVAARAAGWIPFIGGKIKDARDAVEGFQNSFGTGLTQRGGEQVKKGFSDIGHGAAKAFTGALKKGTSDDPKTTTDTKKAGNEWGKTFGNSAIDAVKQIAPTVSKTVSDALQNAIQAAHQRIQDSVRSAKDNLDRIGQDLAKTIEKIQAKIGGAAGGIAGSPQGAAFEKLKKLIESGAPSFEISKAAAELQGQLGGVGDKAKSQVGTQLANLTAAFNKGQISYKGFQSRLHEILSKDGITLKEALKEGGPAFAETFKAQVRALREQARAIAAVPAKFRGIGGAGGAADIRIIRPLEVIRDENRRIAVAAANARARAERTRLAQLKEAQKQTAIQQQLATVSNVATGTGGDRHRAGARGHTSQLVDALKEHGRATREAAARRLRSRQRTPAIRLPALVESRPQFRAGRGGPVPQPTVTFAVPKPAPRGPSTASRLIPAITLLRADVLRVGAEGSRQRESELRLLAQIVARLGRERGSGNVLTSLGRSLSVVRGEILKVTVEVARQGTGQTRLLERFISGILGRRRAPLSFAPVIRPLELVRESNIRICGAVDSQHADLARALREVVSGLAAADRHIVTAELQVRQPIENLRRTELRIADQAERQRTAQLRATNRTNTLLGRLHSKGRTPGYDNYPKGKGSDGARRAARAGVRP